MLNVRTHDHIASVFSISYVLPILFGYLITIGLNPETYVHVIGFCIFMLMVSIYSCFFLIYRSVKTRSALTSFLKVYLLAVLTCMTFINVVTPASGWDFFGEFDFEGIGHVSLRYIGIDVSAEHELLRSATDRHPHHLMAYLGAFAFVSEKYLYGYGTFLHWAAVYLVSGVTIFMTAISKRGDLVAPALVIMAIFMSIPLLSMHASYGGYSEMWTVCGVVLIQYLILSLMLRPDVSVERGLCLLAVSVATLFTRASAYIYVTIIYFTFTVAMTLYYFESRRPAVKASWLISGVCVLTVFICLMLSIPYLANEQGVLPVAGKALYLISRDMAEVMVNEFHALFVLSSFSILPIMWILACIYMAGRESSIEPRKHRLINRFHIWSVAVTWLLLIVFQYTDYGAAISALGSDTGLSRLHIVLIAMQSFSIASFFSLSGPNRSIASKI